MDRVAEVKEVFGDAVADLYAKGVQALKERKGGDVSTDALEGAMQKTEGTPESTKTTPAYAEMLLAYGKALLESVREMAAEEGVLGPALPTGDADDEGDEEDGKKDEDGARGPQDDGKATPTEGGNGNGEGDEEDADDDGGGEEEDEDRKQEGDGDGKQEGDGDGKQERDEDGKQERDEDGKQEEDEGAGATDDQDLFELTWEQLECARVLFDGLKERRDDRLADVMETLGDFGMENDNFEQAASDYQAAIELLKKVSGPDARSVGGLYHSRYLALRRIDPLNAIASLNDAVKLFERRIALAAKDGREGDLKEETELCDEMREEVRGFSAAIEKAKSAAEASGDATTATSKTTIGFGSASEADGGTATVVTVQPRKRPRPESGSDGAREPHEKIIAKVEADDKPQK